MDFLSRHSLNVLCPLATNHMVLISFPDWHWVLELNIIYLSNAYCTLTVSEHISQQIKILKTVVSCWVSAWGLNYLNWSHGLNNIKSMCQSDQILQPKLCRWSLNNHKISIARIVPQWFVEYDCLRLSRRLQRLYTQTFIKIHRENFPTEFFTFVFHSLLRPELSILMQNKSQICLWQCDRGISALSIMANADEILL